MDEDKTEYSKVELSGESNFINTCCHFKRLFYKAKLRWYFQHTYKYNLEAKTFLKDPDFILQLWDPGYLVFPVYVPSPWLGFPFC